MDFEITEDQKLLKQNVRDFMEKEVAPHVDEWESDGDIPDRVFEQMGEQGILGAPIPEEYGGSGLDYVTYTMITEEVGRVFSSLRTTLSVNTTLFGMNVLEFGSEEQKQRYLPEIASGEGRGAWALTEPRSGSDAAGMRTTAERDGDEWVLNGSKMWISDGGKADYHVVYARTNEWDPSEKYEDINAFIVHASDPGFEVGGEESNSKLGLRASPTAELNYDDCRIPEDRLLGEPGSGWEQANTTLNGGRLSVSAGGVGMMQAAYEASLDYVEQREAFGREIGDFQLVKEHLAYIKTKLDATRLLVRRAAWRVDEGLPHRQQVSIAKLKAAEACMDVAERAVQIHGGNGYSGDYPVERIFRDAKILGIYEGTNEIQKLIIGSEVQEGAGA
jgi:alkylation response protein AidB-like acyl-CoA dehydrogenase